jgi:RNA polymerase sigma-70 factor, ECF subfamily
VNAFIGRHRPPGLLLSFHGGGQMPVDGAPDHRFGEFCGWLTRSQPDLRRLALRLTSSATDAADLAQATSLRALEKRALFVSGSFNELKRWLTRIMFNLHFERLRGAVREVLADWLDEVPASSEPPPPLWLTVADEELDAAVAQLNPTLRGAYVLYAVEGCSYAEISSRLQIPLQTVATKIHRARARLRETLTASHQGTGNQLDPYGASRSCKSPVIICKESAVQDSW